MFWNRAHDESPEEPRHGRDPIRNRLRLALEFATLGAYELFEQGEERDEERSTSTVAPPQCDGGRQTGRSGPSARSTVAAPSCHSRHAIVPDQCSARVPHVPVRGLGRRRAGAVEVPRQPCVWPAE